MAKKLITLTQFSLLSRSMKKYIESLFDEIVRMLMITGSIQINLTDDDGVDMLTDNGEDILAVRKNLNVTTTE